MFPVQPNAGWRVSVYVDNGAEVVGQGVLVTPNQVLTCAHVVAAALDADPGGPAPAGQLLVSFPGCRGRELLACRVVEKAWHPLRPDGSGDIAVLRLLRPPPEGARPAALGRWDRSVPTEAWVFGHSAQTTRDGGWAVTRTTGSAGPDGEWVQLDQDGRNYRVDRGYSGAGVLDRRTGKVVGIAVGRDHVMANHVAWMIPMETVHRYWRGLPLGSGRRGSARIPPQLEDELVRMLLRIDGISDPRARGLHISLFQGRYPARPEVERHPEDDFEDVRGLLRACLDRPGGMRTLSAVLEPGGTHPVPRAIQEFDELVKLRFPPPLLTYEERDRLYELLGQVDARDLPPDLARRAVGPVGPTLEAHPEDLIDVAEELEEVASRTDGLPPLLVYAGLVARLLADETGPQLRQWAETTAKRLQLPYSTLNSTIEQEARLSHSHPAVPSPWYLVVELHEDGAAPDHYQMTVSLQGATEPGRGLLVDDEPRRLWELPARLEAGLAAVPADVIRSGRLTVEFVLPRALLNEPVDEWRIGADNVPQRLSLAYPVHVRSQERARSPGLRAAWLRRWEAVKQYGPNRRDRHVYWIDRPDDSPPEVLQTQVGYDDLLLCLAIGHAPQAYPDRARDLVRIGWAGGVPIMLWCRDDREFSEFRSAVQDMLRAGGLSGLPEQVHRLRNLPEGAADRGHLGRQLTLLWDDADRGLDDVALRAPG